MGGCHDGPMAGKFVKAFTNDKRRRERKENKRLRKEGPDTAKLGGSDKSQRRLLRTAKADLGSAREDVKESRAETGVQLEETQGRADQSNRDYRNDRGLSRASREDFIGGIGSIGAGADQASTTRNNALGGATGIRNNALASNQLTGSAESILAQRQAQLAGVPTIGQATNNAISAQAQSANAMLANQVGIQNRAARGLAGSMGEGGALAMQQAIGGAAAGAADQAAQSQLAQNQLASQMRFNAALTQNQQDVAAADAAVGLRMGAAEQERQAQLGIAGANAADTLSVGGANAANGYDATLQAQQARGALMGGDAAKAQASGAYAGNMLGAANSMAVNRATLAQDAKGQANQNQQFMAAGIDQMQNQNAYEAAKRNNPLQKAISTVFDPGDLRGSGSKGVVG
jgi:hypothetical protein